MALISVGGPVMRLVVVVLLLHTCAFYMAILRKSDVTNKQIPSQCLVNNSTHGNRNILQLKRGTRIVNAIITEYDVILRDRLDKLIADNVSPRDKSLISLIREMMDPPSKHMIKPVKKVVQTPQSNVVMEVLKRKRNGFFIEAGGLDGERSSNTVYFEQRMGWTGLLVEMDPYFYTQLLGKSRRCWSINACISPSQESTKLEFIEASGGTGQLMDDRKPPGAVTRLVPCFPLESLLLALNTTHVDYFSLDVEGFELDVLKTIPFDRLDIDVFSVEYVHGRNGKESYKDFMEEKGYTTYKDIIYTDTAISMYVYDYIFVKTKILL